MKIRVPLLALSLTICSIGMNAQDITQVFQDHFLPMGCDAGTGSVPDSPRPISITDETLKRHRLSGRLPAYPEAARAGNLKGVVVLFVVVNESGTVSKITVGAGNSILARAAVRAVRTWKYRPVLVDENPIVVRGEVVLTFRGGPKPSVVEEGQSPLRMVGCTSPGRILHRVEPEYPRVARAAHVMGDVVLEIVIDKQGNVATAKALSGHPLLIESAMNAVKQWRYEPMVLGDGPVIFEARVVLQFHM